MSLISGARGTGSVTSTRRKYDVSDKLWMVDPDFAVLSFFARKLNKARVIDPEYRWFDKEQPSRYDAAGSTITADITALVVVDGTKFRNNDVVMNVSTGEHMLVTDISTNTLTVKRGHGSTAATTSTSADVLVILGSSYQEHAASGIARTSQSVKRANYTQIFREPIEVTGTEDATELYAGGNDLAQLRREHLNIHMTDIERSAFFGEAKEDTTGTHPQRTSAGIKSFLSSNLKNATGILTEAEFEDWVRMLFDKGGDKKMGFLSPLIGSAVNSWAKGKLQMFPKDKTYGIGISSYLSIHGQLDFVIEKLFSENATWNGMAFGVDMSKVGYRYLGGNGKNRDTKLMKDRQDQDIDGVKEEYLSEIGFWLALENRHGLLYGVTSYS